MTDRSAAGLGLGLQRALTGCEMEKMDTVLLSTDFFAGCVFYATVVDILDANHQVHCRF